MFSLAHWQSIICVYIMSICVCISVCMFYMHCLLSAPRLIIYFPFTLPPFTSTLSGSGLCATRSRLASAAARWMSAQHPPRCRPSQAQPSLVLRVSPLAAALHHWPRIFRSCRKAATQKRRKRRRATDMPRRCLSRHLHRHGQNLQLPQWRTRVAAAVPRLSSARKLVPVPVVVLPRVVVRTCHLRRVRCCEAAPCAVRRRLPRPHLPARLSGRGQASPLLARPLRCPAVLRTLQRGIHGRCWPAWLRTRHLSLCWTSCPRASPVRTSCCLARSFPGQRLVAATTRLPAVGAAQRRAWKHRPRHPLCSCILC